MNERDKRWLRLTPNTPTKDGGASEAVKARIELLHEMAEGVKEPYAEACKWAAWRLELLLIFDAQARHEDPERLNWLSMSTNFANFYPGTCIGGPAGPEPTVVWRDSAGEKEHFNTLRQAIDYAMKNDE